MMMGKIRKNLQYVGSAARLCGPRVGMTSLFHYLTHRDADAYYAKLVDASWNSFMKDIPLDAKALQTCSLPNDGPIWVMWWQGLDGTEPPIVRACIDSIRRHANGRPVHIITKDTIVRYVTIDASIMNKVRGGKITITTLSDIIRFALLHEHGGIWMDATIYLTADLSRDIEQYPFYSIPNHETAPIRNWTGYFMGGAKGNPLFAYMYQAFVTMYAHVDRIPEYFMIDVMLSAAYTHIPQVRGMIDAVPVNNIHRLYLADKLAESSVTLPADTYAYKLSYKNLEDVPMRGTVYGALLKGTW